MPTIEGVRLKVLRKYIDLTYKIRRKKINCDNFTIISNNCWAGRVYQSYGIAYNTPTIGLFIMPEDYLKLVGNLKGYISTELKFVKPSESKWNKELKNNMNYGNYPIGLLGDVEILFLHYKSEEEAYEKWSRRCKRVNWDKLIYKFNDQNGCTIKDLIEFERLPLKNKICFTASKCDELKNAIYVRSDKRVNYIRASYEPFGKSKYIDMNNFINSLDEV